MERLSVLAPSNANARTEALPGPVAVIARPCWMMLALGLCLASTPAVVVGQQHTPPTSLSTREIATRATPATVTIVTFDAAGDTLAQGSGFFVRSSAVVLTNWHVMQGAAAAVVIRPNGEEFSRVHFLDGDSTIDLALLKVPGYGLPVLPTRADAPAVGERVVTIGSPLGLAKTVAEGIVSAVRVVDGHKLIQISAPISHGSSGGAVLDQAGRVFAVSTAQIADGQQLNFAVPVRYALGLLTESHTERNLIAVFGGNGPAAGSASVASTSAARSTPAPGPAAIVRPTMDGIWVGREQGGPTAGPTAFGELLFIADGSGFMLYSPYLPGDTLADLWHVTPIEDARVAADGRIAFSLSRTDYDGYETDDGFVTNATVRSSDGAPAVHSHAVYQHTTLPLTQNGGPYDVTECRTYYYDANGQVGSPPLDWTGTLVAAVNRDTLYLEVSLQNADGGTTGLWGTSLLGADGAFDVAEKAGTHLTGTIHHGVITATWTDRRDGGSYFRGTLEATRR